MKHLCSACGGYLAPALDFPWIQTCLALTCTKFGTTVYLPDDECASLDLGCCCCELAARLARQSPTVSPVA